MDIDSKFSELVADLGLTDECDTTILKMRIAFMVGTGQSVDVAGFKRALEFARVATDAKTQVEHRPCKCSDTGS